MRVGSPRRIVTRITLVDGCRSEGTICEIERSSHSVSPGYLRG